MGYSPELPNDVTLATLAADDPGPETDAPATWVGRLRAVWTALLERGTREWDRSAATEARRPTVD